jgi:hypothetical protein
VKFCERHQVDEAAPDPLEAIVDAFLANNAKVQGRYLRFFAIQPTMADAVAKSALAELPGGGRFSHQRLIPHSTLVEAKERLLKLNFTSVRTFDELHTLVAKTIGPISFIGPLTIYDTAHRIGAHLHLYSEFVYLHAGVCSGAKALGLDYKAAKLLMSALPKAFQRLRPEQAEDCLCIYKDNLKALKR